MEAHREGTRPHLPLRLAARDEDFAREGLDRVPAPREDGRRVPLEPGTFEWWYFDFHGEDGTVVVANFLTKPMSRIRDGIRPHVKLTVTRPDGTERRVEDWVEPREFRASTESCDVVLGASRARGDLRRYTVHAQAGGIAVDMDIEGVAPPWRPGVGRMVYGADEARFFGWMVPVPFGTATVRLSEGGGTREIRGTAYHDHNYGNLVMSDVCDSWWWSRTQVGDCTVIAVELVGSARYGGVRTPLFMLARGDRLLADDGTRMVLHRHDPVVHEASGKAVERRLVFEYRDGALRLDLELVRRRDLYALDLRTYLPAWKAALARLLGIRPWYLRFLGTARLDLDLDGAREHHEAEAIYELMSFRGP